MKVVIMAGGRGTRIASVNADVPKPMIRICGKPILEHQIECLRRQGLTDIIISTGYLSHVIEEHFRDGSGFGVHIDYLREDEPLGTAGALFYLRERVREDFLLINGDIIFDVDIARFTEAHARHARKGGLATVFTHPNGHPYDSGIILADTEGMVTKWLTKEDPRTWYRNRTNAGLHMLSSRLLERTPFQGNGPIKLDLDRDILKPLISRGELFVYDSPEYVKDMGTPDRYRAVERDLESGLVAGKNLSARQRAVFLDRDGTINEYVGFLTDVGEMRLLPGAAEAIRRINESGYLAIVVTNQPVIARGEVTEEDLDEIHAKMETLLGMEGAYVDDILYCPHHPDKGFAGERPEYKVECECRKPKAGLLLRAAEKYNVDLKSSWMVGDGPADMLAGLAAGCRVVGIGRRSAEGVPVPVPVCDSLGEAVDRILGESR